MPTTSPTEAPSSVPSESPSTAPVAIVTNLPTTLPSASFLTSSPTSVTVNSIPVLRKIDVLSISSSSTSIIIYFASSTIFSGSLFCNYILSSKVNLISNYRSFVLSGSFQTYAIGTITANMSLTGLVAAQNYTIFCGVVSSSGTSSSDSEISSVRAVFTTSCCRQVTFTSYPSFMYNQPSYYNTINGIYYGKNSFTVELSSIPNGFLSLRPVLLYPNSSVVTSALATFSPSQRIWFSNSTSLTSSYSLILSEALVGDTDYKVKLSSIGSDTVNYNISMIAPLNVIDVADPPPAPSINTVLFSDTGNGLHMVFDSSTNYGGMSSSDAWICSKLWNFTDSESSSCTWLNKTTIFASLPSPSTLIPGESATLKGGLVSAECILTSLSCSDYNTISATTIVILSPLNPMIPSVALTGSSQFAKCANVTLDATGSIGSGGREWTSIYWQAVYTNGTSSYVLEEYLNRQFSFTMSLGQRIIIPSWIFADEVYYVTLFLTNFLGQTSSATLSFVYGVDGSIPMVKIGGSSSRTMKASSTLALYAFVELSACASVSTMSYTWTVMDITTTGSSIAGGVSTTITSTSKDPWIFSSSAYTFTANKQYAIRFTGVSDVLSDDGTYYLNSTTSVSVTVLSGAIHAVISGASVRYITKDTVLDSSSSYDEDSNSTMSLSHQWSCSYGSGDQFGESCDLVVGFDNVTFSMSSQILISYTALTSGISYIFTVIVSDVTRSDSTTVELIRVASPVAVDLDFVSVADAFNKGSSSVLDASVTCATNTYAGWGIWIDGVRQAIQTSTKPARYLSEDDVSDGLNFPLQLSDITFPGGSIVDIRFGIFEVISSSTPTVMDAIDTLLQVPWSFPSISSSMDHRSLQIAIKPIAYSQVSIKVNLPPQSGSLTVSPSSGTALVTMFAASTFNWQDDASDLPLRYDFRYSSDGGSSYLFAQAMSVYSSVSMVLPSGAQSLNERVLMVVRAYDIYDAQNSRTTNVTVRSASELTMNFVSVLSSLYSSASVTGGTDQVVTILNAVSTTMNSINCSTVSTSYCASLNRYPCLKTPQKCSSCFTNYTGVSGDANYYCHSPDSDSGKAIGEPCNSNNDCTYGLCSSTTFRCIAPIKRCPSFDGISECGGTSQGECKYFISGVSVDSSQCTIFDTSCTPRCVCKDGYGGKLCVLTSSQLLQRSSARSNMCGYLSNVISKSDASSSLVDNLSSSLLSIYDENEVVTSTGLESCKTALTGMLSTLSSNIDMTTSLTASNILSTLSKFLVKGNSSFISDSMTTFVKAALKGMVKGQSDMQLTSDNVKIGLIRSLSSDIANSNQSVPLSDEESSYGKQAMRMELSDDASTACDDSTGYVSMSLGSFAVSPFTTSDSSSLTTAMMRSETLDYSYESDMVSTSAVGTMKRRALSTSSNVAYYMSFPFTQSQHFVQNEQVVQDSNGTWITVYNETIPSCTQFSSFSSVTGNTMTKSLECSSCNVSTYTNDSVVFACYDISQVCSYGNRRRLQVFTDDDTYVIQATSQGVNAVYQTAALTKAVVSTIANVLSFNPFAVNIEQAKGVIAFVSTLVFVTFVGMILLYRWDRSDRIELLYMYDVKFNDKKAKARDSSVVSTPSPTTPNKSSTLVTRSVSFEDPTKKKNSLDQMDQLNVRSILKNSSRDDKDKAIVCDCNDNDGKDNYLNVIYNFRTLIGHSIPIDIHEINKMSLLFRYFIHPFLYHHEYFMFAGEPSLSQTRVWRWINFCLTVYFGLFLDTLFFSIFYSDQGSCQVYTNESTCIAEINAITSTSQCIWDDSNGCSLQSPPDSTLFSVIVSCVTMLLAVPLSFLFDYLLNEICCKRPDFTTIGWNTLYWLGIASYDIRSSTWLANDMYEQPKEMPDEEDEGIVEIDPRLGSRSLSSYASQFSLGISMDSEEKEIEKNKRDALVEDESNMQSIDELIYYDIGTIEDEMKAILNKSMPYFNYPIAQIKRASVWGIRRSYLSIEGLREYWMRMLWICGWDRGSVRSVQTSSIPRLRSRIMKARQKAKEIRESLGDCPDEEEEEKDNEEDKEEREGSHNMDIHKHDKGEDTNNITMNTTTGTSIVVGECSDGINRNQELLQYFILEQLPSFHRFVLKQQCFTHHDISPDTVPCLIWIAAWLGIFLSIGFFLYWTLSWSLYSGNSTFKAWGNVLLANVLQDIFLLQLCKVYILHVSTQAAIIPRLLVIKGVLEKLVYDLHINYVTRLEENEKNVLDSDEEVENDNINNKLSPEIVDVALVQHFSPSCRVARSRHLQHLPASWLLQHVNDLHIYECRKPPYSTPIGLLSLCVLAIPVFVTMFSEDLAESVFESLYSFVITTVYACIVYLFIYHVETTSIVISCVGFIWIIYAFTNALVIKGYELIHMHDTSDSNVNNNVTVLMKRKSIFIRLSYAMVLLRMKGKAYIQSILIDRVYAKNIQRERNRRIWMCMNRHATQRGSSHYTIGRMCQHYGQNHFVMERSATVSIAKGSSLNKKVMSIPDEVSAVLIPNTTEKYSLRHKKSFTLFHGALDSHYDLMSFINRHSIQLKPIDSVMLEISDDRNVTSNMNILSSRSRDSDDEDDDMRDTSNRDGIDVSMLYTDPSVLTHVGDRHRIYLYLLRHGTCSQLVHSIQHVILRCLWDRVDIWQSLGSRDTNTLMNTEDMPSDIMKQWLSLISDYLSLSSMKTYFYDNNGHPDALFLANIANDHIDIDIVNDIVIENEEHECFWIENMVVEKNESVSIVGQQLHDAMITQAQGEWMITTMLTVYQPLPPRLGRSSSQQRRRRRQQRRRKRLRTLSPEMEHKVKILIITLYHQWFVILSTRVTMMRKQQSTITNDTTTLCRDSTVPLCNDSSVPLYNDSSSVPLCNDSVPLCYMLLFLEFVGHIKELSLYRSLPQSFIQQIGRLHTCASTISLDSMQETHNGTHTIGGVVRGIEMDDIPLVSMSMSMSTISESERPIRVIDNNGERDSDDSDSDDSGETVHVPSDRYAAYILGSNSSDVSSSFRYESVYSTDSSFVEDISGLSGWH